LLFNAVFNKISAKSTPECNAGVKREQIKKELLMMKALCRPLSIAKCLLLSAVILVSPSLSAETLKQAVTTATLQNPDVRFAAIHRWVTEMQLTQQKAGYWPVVEIAGGVGWENSNNPTAAAITGGPAQTLRRNESSLSLIQNLFAGFSTDTEVKRLQETVNAAAYNVNGVAQDTALLVTEKYLEVLRHQQFVAESQSNLAVHEKIYGMIKDRSGAGISKEADLDQAEGRLALARANLIAEQASLRDAELAYMRVVGDFPQRLVLPRAPAERDLPVSERQAVLTSLNNNPILKSANADIEAAKAQHKTSKSTNYPRIDAVLSGSRNSNLDGQPGVNNDQLAMLRGTWNLFNGGADIARQQETAYQVQESAEVRNRTILQIKESMGFSWNAWKSAGKRLVPLAEHRKASKATVDAYDEQFKIGQRSLLDLLDAQNEYFQSRLNYITGEFTETYARYRILNVMGSLMQHLGVPLPVESSPARPDTKPYNYGGVIPL
jgi:adhesin transport system outer membrane protein